MPADLAAVAAYAVVALLVTELVAMPPVRAVVVTPLLLFVPGYVFVAAIYPDRHQGARRFGLRSGQRRDHLSGIHPIERAGLSFGISVALLPLIGGTLWALFSRLSLEIVLFGLVTFSLAMAIVASARRSKVPADKRFRVRFWSQLRRFWAWLTGQSNGQTAVNLFLVASVAVAAAVFVYAFAVPISGESYTTAMLVTEQDGEYVTSGYPTTFTAGESETLTLQLSNHEGSETRYTVVAAVEAVEDEGNSPSIVLRSELDRLEMTLRPGETVRREHAVTPETVGEDLRLSYYVYKGDAPDTLDAESAYRDLHVWITVERP